MNDWKLPRRDLLGLAAAFGTVPAIAAAQSASLDVVPLWPGNPPGSGDVRVTEQIILRTPGGDPTDTAFLNVTRPWLMMRRPAVSNGAAVLVIPGGGFQRVAVSRSGGAIDRWLASLGYTAFVMNYRLPADGWAAGPDAPLQDAQRALRLIRARSSELGIDPERVSVLGFSAGGYVAGRLSTRFRNESYEAVDAADSFSTRPSACGLFYPVITMSSPHAHPGSLRSLLGNGPSDGARRSASVEAHVTADTPATFIAAAADDTVVAVENSLLMWSALRAQNISTEMHLFETGGHSLGGGDPAAPEAVWPKLLSAFLKRHGV